MMWLLINNKVLQRYEFFSVFRPNLRKKTTISTKILIFFHL